MRQGYDLQQDAEFKGIKARLEAAQGAVRRALIGSQVTSTELFAFAGDLFITEKDDIGTIQVKLNALEDLALEHKATLLAVQNGSIFIQPGMAYDLTTGRQVPMVKEGDFEGADNGDTINVLNRLIEDSDISDINNLGFN